VEGALESADSIVVGAGRVDGVARDLCGSRGVLGIPGERMGAKGGVAPVERCELRRQHPLVRLPNRELIVAEPPRLLLQARDLARGGAGRHGSSAYDEAEHGGERMLEPAVSSAASRA